MPSLTLPDISVPQIAAMAAGLADAGDLEGAAALYRQALTWARGEARERIRMRLGILQGRPSEVPMLRRVLRELEQGAPGVFVGEGLATWNKTLPFMEDERFLELASRHGHLMPAANWHWNLQTVLWAVQRARDLDGDLVELGVFKGKTTLFCAEYLDFAAWPKTWTLYDTFEGIPDDQIDPGWAEANEAAYKGTFSYEEVRDRFAPFPNIEVVKGRVPDVFAEACPERICFVHIDLNNTAAEIQALDALYDRLVPSGMIVFDDFAWRPARAQYNAETEWFAARGERVLPLSTGQGLFIKR